jgi:hypothetical protein
MKIVKEVLVWVGSQEGGPPTWGWEPKHVPTPQENSQVQGKPPLPTNSSFYERMWEHIRIGGSWPRVGIMD